MFHNDYIKNYGTSPLKIEFYERKSGKDTDKGMNVHFPDFVQQSFFKLDDNPLSKLFVYCSNKLHYQQLTEGSLLIEKLKELNLFTVKKDELVLIEGYKEKKSAIICPYIHKQSQKEARVEVKPMVYFPTIAVHGFTVAPGYFCDFIMVENDKKKLKGYTIHFEEHHFGVVVLMLELFCQTIYEFIQTGDLPSDYAEFSKSEYPFENEDYLNVKQSIYSFIEEQVNRNHTKNISAICENGFSIQELVKKYKEVSNRLYVHAPILNISLLLGKPPSQVIQYIESE